MTAMSMSSINNLDGSPQLLRNDGGNANDSVLVKTIGVKSNRDGIGARVKVVSGDLIQVDEVRSGGSYLSHNDLRLVFWSREANEDRSNRSALAERSD